MRFEIKVVSIVLKRGKSRLKFRLRVQENMKTENIKKMKVTHFTPCDKKHYIAKSLQKNQKNEIVI